MFTSRIPIRASKGGSFIMPSGAAQWFDMSQYSVPNGQAIGANALDLSGNARHSASGSAGTFTTNVQNGLPGLRIGVSGFKHLLTTYAVNSGAFSIAMACLPLAAGNRLCAGSNNWLIGPYNGVWQAHSGGFLNTGVARGTTYKTVIFTQAAATGSNAGNMYVNSATAFNGLGGAHPGTMGYGPTGPYVYESFEGYLFEAAVWTRVLTAEEIAKIVAGWAMKWGP